MKRFLPSILLFLIGGGIYYMLEILWRGFSHWSMFLAGGACFWAVDDVNRRLKKGTPIWVRCSIGAAIITVLEFVAGCIVNLWAHWNVWDYSRVYFNFMGQVCLLYTVIWFFLSAPLIWLAAKIRTGVEQLFHIKR